MIERMRKSWLRRLWPLLSGLLLVAPVIGQEKGKPIEIRFAAQAAPEKLGPLVMIAEEERSEPFELPLNFLSQPRTAPARVVTLERETKAGALAAITPPPACAT
jgi:hypothetical protein